MSHSLFLYSVLALLSWTFVMWFWMYATRIPAMLRANIDVDELSRTGAPLVLPPQVSRVADNYNHLHEQPTAFYALVLCAAALGAIDDIQIGLAWAYVAVRVIHSLVQAIKNPITIRFGLFVIASAILLALLLRTIYLAT
ncbi:MAG: MAPEG family protein [Pseudomonadaceae bacterium]|nr:MAPEG family protein [Pseudomonadaceae bacterium]